MNKPTKEEIRAQLDFLKELDRAYWEKRHIPIAFHITERDENGEFYTSKVLVMNTDHIPEEYVKIPGGEYSPEEYEKVRQIMGPNSPSSSNESNH